MIITQSSARITFYKIIECPKKGKRMWQLYHYLDIMGEIFSINGNDNIFITSSEHIYTYQIDGETLCPKLQNVVNNYMQCTSVLVSSRGVRYLVAYKRHET